MNNPIIILGGMGPQASLCLHRLLIERSTAFHGPAPDEFPAILHASMPVPDFIASSEQYESAVELVANTCAQLPLFDAGVIGMACNTAHLMLDRLPLAGTSFVSMIEAVSMHVASLGARRVGLLASPHTIKTGLYTGALAAKSIGTVLPTEQEQEVLHDIITAVIGGASPQGLGLRRRLSALAAALQARGADAMLLGCTELPLVGVDSPLPVVDSLEVLADTMLEKYYQDKV